MVPMTSSDRSFPVHVFTPRYISVLKVSGLLVLVITAQRFILAQNLTFCILNHAPVR